VKIIFLDFDGVLNSLDAILHSGSYGGITPLFKRHAEVMEFIIRHTEAKIVVSSTWRLGKTLKELQDLLPKLPIIGKTKSLTSQIRGVEIQAWIDDNKNLEIGNFAIIDDDSDMGNLKHKLIRTKFDYGLTYVEAVKCIEMLNGNDDSVWNNRVLIHDAIIAKCHDDKKNLNDSIISVVSDICSEMEQENE